LLVLVWIDTQALVSPFSRVFYFPPNLGVLLKWRVFDPHPRIDAMFDHVLVCFLQFQPTALLDLK
jgi:hypothetical protein